MQTGEELFGSFYPKGEVIFRQGELGDRMYIIQSGAVQISHNQGGHETVIAVRGKGDFFGEMTLIEAEQRSATATAVRDTRLIALSRATLLQKVQADPGVALHILKGLIVRIQEVDQKIQAAVQADEILRAALARSAAADAGTAFTPPEPAAPAAGEISTGDLAKIWKVSEATRWVQAGEIVFEEGHAGAEMYIVLDGTVEMAQGAGAERRVLRRVEAGDFFGEWALVTGSPRAATVLAVTRTQLLAVEQARFDEQVRTRPELAVYLLQHLAARLRQASAALANPRAAAGRIKKSWQPLIQKRTPLKIGIVSLATCAGCSAVLLDDEILAQVLAVAEIDYCPMLIDQDQIRAADLILVDGAVRLKEDQEKLEEARAKSRFLAAWGTCAAFGGIPAEANRFELEDLIAETFGQAADTFAYYLSGERGAGQRAYREEGVALLRKAGKLDDFVRVDYYIPGCPPTPAMLLQLAGELTGQPAAKAQPVVCGQCLRKPNKAMPSALVAYPQGDEDPAACFNSLGVLCLGFMIQGGCEAACTRRGLPCWGCRGPAKMALKKMADGDSFEEAVVQAIARRCHFEENQARALIRQLRLQGHNLFRFDPNAGSSLTRVR